MLATPETLTVDAECAQRFEKVVPTHEPANDTGSWRVQTFLKPVVGKSCSGGAIRQLDIATSLEILARLAA